jgi:hypothetical protein
MFLVVFYWVVIKTKLNIFIIPAIPCDYFLYMWILMNIFLHMVREKTLRAVATHGHSTSLQYHSASLFNIVPHKQSI